MIKIRYLDLPTGLHVRAEAQGADTIVYLLPGLTTAQRRAALLGARSGARMGRGPRLPATGLACAVAADRVRTTVRNGAAAMRVHPGIVLSLVVVMVSAALAYLLLLSSVTYQPPGAGPGPGPNPLAQGAAPPSTSHDRAGPPGHSARGQAGRRPGRPGRPPGSPPRASRSPAPSPSGPPAPLPGSPPGGPPGSPPPGLPPPGLPPSPGPLPPVGPPGSPPSSPSPSPAPGRPGRGGCVAIGPLGICVHL